MGSAEARARAGLALLGQMDENFTEVMGLLKQMRDQCKPWGLLRLRPAQGWRCWGT